MKILYAAPNNSNAKIQLARFLDAMQGSDHQIKLAAYKRSMPKDTNIDWCLDALLNFCQPETTSLNNDNLVIYFDQIKSYAPDLIISDLEYFTSFIANELNVPLWQCSSSLINFAMTRREKYDLGLSKYYLYAANMTYEQTQRIVHLIDNSDRNFVYSHFGDAENPPTLQNGFEWIRPYHQIHKEYEPCQHYAAAALTNSDKNIIGVLKKYADSVVFTDCCAEKYQNVLMKDIAIQDEYYCNLKNSPIFICQGQTSFLADAFYNGKFSIIYPDYNDAEAVINSQLTKKFGLGRITTYTEDINLFSDYKVNPTYNENIKQLHEKIEEL